MVVSCQKHGLAIIPGRQGQCRKCLAGEAASAPRIPASSRLPCRHFGAATGGSVTCPSCTGKVELKLFNCALHTDCTPATPVDGHFCCATCPDYAAPPMPAIADGPVCVRVTADGIGDAVLGLTACAGLQRQHPSAEIIYCPKPWQRPWVKLFGGYDRLGSGTESPIVFSPHDTYAQQNAERLKRPRWEHYANACGTVAVLPVARPLPPEAIRWAQDLKGAVVLAPFSGWARPGNPPSMPNNRCWLMSHWLHLERLLHEQGRSVVVLDGRTEDRERTHAFRSVILRDEPPERVAAVMALSECVVGSDSGMAHVAGMLRVPTVVLCGPVDGERIFGIYPTVRVLNAPLPCAGCHWQASHGWHPLCDTVCANLQMIQPANVLAAVAGISSAPPGLVHDPATDRVLADMLAHLAAPVPDRRHTMTAFLRAMAQTPSPLVLETGCIRSDDDYGAGNSTLLFGRFLAAHGGSLLSLDNSAEHCGFARSRVKGLPVTVIQTDSRQFLRDYDGQISALYLDSQDTWEAGFADCCLEEAQLAWPHLSPGAVILVDDSPRLRDGWTGKGAKSIPWLLSQGCRIVYEGYQCLLEKEGA